MKYKFLVDRANRGDLVEEVLERRSNWKSGIPLKNQNGAIWKFIPRLIKNNEWNFIWRRTVNVTDRDEKFNIFSLPETNDIQMVNHFPNPDIITRKTNLVRTLRKKFINYDKIPDTYVLGEDLEMFLARKDIKENIWIVKPEYLHSGKGIELFDNLEDIVNHIQNVQEEGEGEWIIQKYIKNPLLIEGRKFDIRVNVLVTDNFEIFMNPFGFVRTIGHQYYPYLTGNSIDDKLIHITNHSVQKNSPLYEEFEEANVMSLPQLQSYFDFKYGYNTLNIERDLFPQWKEIIRDTITSGKKEMIKGIGNRRCFEVFGFDFLIDDSFKTWMLEVNTNTGLEQDVEWANKVVRRMLEEMVQLTVDTVFNTKIIKNVPSSIYDIPPQELKWLKPLKKTDLKTTLYGPSWLKI